MNDFDKGLEILSNVLQIKSYEILLNDFNNTDLMKYLRHQDDLLNKIIEQNEVIISQNKKMLEEKQNGNRRLYRKNN